MLDDKKIERIDRLLWMIKKGIANNFEKQEYIDLLKEQIRDEPRSDFAIAMSRIDLDDYLQDLYDGFGVETDEKEE